MNIFLIDSMLLPIYLQYSIALEPVPYRVKLASWNDALKQPEGLSGRSTDFCMSVLFMTKQCFYFQAPLSMATFHYFDINAI